MDKNTLSLLILLIAQSPSSRFEQRGNSILLGELGFPIRPYWGDEISNYRENVRRRLVERALKYIC